MTDNQNVTNDNPSGDRQSKMRPTVVMVLFAIAEAIVRGLPGPRTVHVSTRYGLDVELSNHADLRVWADRLGLPVQPHHSQPYIDRDQVLCQLTNVYGTWRDVRTNLHCCEPVEAMAAPADGGERP